jgi:hypothetical protein
MNAAQRNIVIIALCALAAALVFVFWRTGEGMEYRHSLLVWQLHETPWGPYGLRIRMGLVGVICGLILPVVLLAAAAFIWKSDR